MVELTKFQAKELQINQHLHKLRVALYKPSIVSELKIFLVALVEKERPSNALSLLSIG